MMKLFMLLNNKYLHSRVLIIDEICMIRRETFEHFYLALKAVIQNSLPFGGVSRLVVEVFLQLSPVNQKGVFMNSSKGSYRSLNGWLRETFQLHELVEIVQKSSDPDFTQLLNRVREGCDKFFVVEF